MKFSWNNKPAKVKFSVFINELEDGGLNLFEPKSFCESLNISWTKRIFGKKELAAYHLNGIHMFKNNFNLLEEILLGSVISMIKIPFKQYHEDTSPLLNGEEVIWNNSGIKINGKSGFFFKHWYQHGIYKVSQFMFGHNTFYVLFSAF